jgi:hypothetical protein
MLKAASFPALTLALAIAFSSAPVLAEADTDEDGISAEKPQTVLTQKEEFDRSSLMTSQMQGSSASGLSFLHPNRFSMRQSYSMSFSSGSIGSQSAGLYLNTLSYKLAEPLTLSADVGFYTPFYSSVPGMRTSGFRDASQGSSIVFPHVGLEYKPSENTSISLHLFNGSDAAKAYGYDGFLYPWFR